MTLSQIYIVTLCMLSFATPFNKSIFRSTPPGRPNKVDIKCTSPFRTSVRLSTESLFDFNKIWFVGRGRWVMHDDMHYDPIQGQGQGQFQGLSPPHL